MAIIQMNIWGERERKRRKAVVVGVCLPSTGGTEAGGRKFEASLNNIMRPCFNKHHNKTVLYM